MTGTPLETSLVIESRSGDCIAYALAHALGEPLLYKGDDFARTDIEAAVHRTRRARKG